MVSLPGSCRARYPSAQISLTQVRRSTLLRAPPSRDKHTDDDKQETLGWSRCRRPVEALAELVTLDGPDVDELLVDLGRRAAVVVPDLVGLSLGLSREGVTFTLVASSAGTAAVDAAQYLDGGPVRRGHGGTRGLPGGRHARPARRGALAHLRRHGGGRRSGEQPVPPGLPRGPSGRRSQPLRRVPGVVQRSSRRPGRTRRCRQRRGGQQRGPVVLEPPDRPWPRRASCTTSRSSTRRSASSPDCKEWRWRSRSDVSARPPPAPEFPRPWSLARSFSPSGPALP